MTIWTREEDIRDRAKEIATILIQHGFSFLVRDLGLNRLFRLSGLLEPGQRDSLKKRITSEDLHELTNKLPAMMESLGPTFIKLGQFLSSRQDLLPNYLTDPLSRLQEQVTPVDFQCILESLDAYLPQHRTAFAQIDPVPVGSASIAQIHSATLRDGRRVVIKVRKPNVMNLIDLDLKILERTVVFLSQQPDLQRMADLRKMYDIFSHSLRKETNFRLEADNMHFFQSILAGSDNVRTPVVEDALTNENILTMEYIDALDIKTAAQLPERTRKKLAKNLLSSFLQQVFLFGVFHGDPHPGNIRLTPEGQVIYLDLGIVGRVDPYLLKLLVEQLIALRSLDVQTMMNSALEMGQQSGSLNWQNFYEDMAELMFTTQQAARGTVEVSQIIHGVIQLSLRHGIRMPDRMILLGRAFSLAEMNARRIDPSIDLLTIAEPLIREFVLRQALPSLDGAALSSEMIQWKKKFSIFFTDIPRYLLGLTRGEKNIPLEISGLGVHFHSLSKALHRLAYSILFAALLIAGAMLLQTPASPLESTIIHGIGYYLLFVALSGTGFLYYHIFRNSRR